MQNVEQLTTGQIKRHYANIKRKIDELKVIALRLANSGYPEGLNDCINVSISFEKLIDENIEVFKTLDEEVKELQARKYFNYLKQQEQSEQPLN